MEPQVLCTGVCVTNNRPSRVLSAAFARLIKGRELIFSVLLMTMMIPGEIYVITNYQTWFWGMEKLLKH